MILADKFVIIQFAHRKCVQRWCNEKGDITYEICHQPYQPGYTAPPPPLQPEVATIDIRPWTVAGAPLGLHDQRILAVAAGHRILEHGYDEYVEPDSSGTEFFRAAALTLIALLSLRHALHLTVTPQQEQPQAIHYSVASELSMAPQLGQPFTIHYSIVAPGPLATPQQEQPQAIHYSIAP
ncbi:hypothetical protein J1N35_019955 [Gossypium stocksii]|uniref:Uncharacterized protein n=1 Tax=Gossypium stocksii TaxID=47602 RepID=A0A9D3VE12_9ROSI|nr:hypothetical protein J1N35_019955 [Gossypium stocksii]